MKIFTSNAELQQYLQKLRDKNQTLGFAPTMGALHAGHLSLLKQARDLNDVVVCSIFVNPTQFTGAADLEKYPRPIAEDTLKLEAAGCDILFNPPVTEMYAGHEHWHLAIGELEHLLEGKFRPGHYQGVTQVVYKLFTMVKPDTAFFGQKDYQQVLVIRKMVELMQMPVKLVMCPIEREPDGLAMSSRNIHLSADDRRHALVLSKALFLLRDNFNHNAIRQFQGEAIALIDSEPGVELEYLEIADGETLRPANEYTKSVVALVAAWVGHTRLIDNVILVHS